MSCRETRAVEALHDGRLADERAETLRLHVVTCADCTREAERLERLSSALASLRGPDANPLRVAAGRRRLLESARRGNGVKPSPFLRLSGFALATSVAAAVAWIGLHSRPWHAAGTTAAATAPAANELALTVTPAARTIWSRERTSAAETLLLEEGSLDVRVLRHDSRRRLLVKLPDGELEDVGTVFSVDAHGGKTRTVMVTEGRVALRLRGQAELVLSAGDSYHAPDAPAAPTSADAASVEGSPSESSEMTATGSAASAPRPAAAAVKAPAHPSAAKSELSSCPSASLFQDGVQAFKRGEYASAASLLERFSAACGGGKHGEDAAYLRMVALARAGKTDEARVQARSYLARYPQGFRSKEAQRLAGSD